MLLLLSALHLQSIGFRFPVIDAFSQMRLSKIFQ